MPRILGTEEWPVGYRTSSVGVMELHKHSLAEQ
jgi:hypothetical protein